MDGDRRGSLRRFGWIQTALGPAYFGAALAFCPIEGAADVLRWMAVAAVMSGGGLVVLYRARAGS